MSSSATTWQRNAIAADVCGVAVGAVVLATWDVIVGARLPPALELGTGALACGATTWAMGTLLAIAVVFGRRVIGFALRRAPTGGPYVGGAIDGAAVAALGVLATDPPSWSPNFRLVVVGGFLVVGIAARVAGEWLARRRPRVTPLVGGALAFAGALALLAMLQWRREEWARLALHLVYFVGAAAVARAAVGERKRVPLVALAVGGVALVTAVVGSTVLLSGSMDARKLLHMRSSHGKAWSVVIERVADRDGDRVSTLFGGRDCDPARRDVFPGASEIAGNGRDDNCQLGDARARPRRSATAHVSPRTPDAEVARVGAAARPDVIVVSMDSLRWDAVDGLVATRSLMGPHAELTRAVTPFPRTLDALAAIVRGRAARGIRFESSPGTRGAIVWRDPSPTLGHILARAGYRVITVPTGVKTDARSGAFAGFESVVASNYDARTRLPPVSPFVYQQVDSDVAFATVLEVARATPGPLAIWVHMLETHAPFYVASRRPAAREDRAGFDQSVRYADRLVSGLLRGLERVRRRPRIVSVLADHGEELGEHGSGYHATSVYAEQVRVAWLISGSRIPAGRFDGPANVTSLPATLLEALGIEAPASMEEPSVLPAMRGAAAWPEVVVTELRGGNRNLVGYTGARYRLVRDVAHDWDELFDSREDPLEQRDLASARPDVLRRMRALAERWEESH